MNHVCTFIRRSHRILGNIGFNASQMEIIACIKHAAVGITPALDKPSVRRSLFCRSYKHFRTVKLLRKHGLGNLRPKIPKINAKCIAALPFDIFKRLQHMYLTFHDTDRTLINLGFIIFCLICPNQILPSGNGK